MKAMDDSLNVCACLPIDCSRCDGGRGCPVLSVKDGQLEKEDCISPHGLGGELKPLHMLPFIVMFSGHLNSVLWLSWPCSLTSPHHVPVCSSDHAEVPAVLCRRPGQRLLLCHRGDGALLAHLFQSQCVWMICRDGSCTCLSMFDGTIPPASPVPTLLNEITGSSVVADFTHFFLRLTDYALSLSMFTFLLLFFTLTHTYPKCHLPTTTIHIYIYI